MLTIISFLTFHFTKRLRFSEAFPDVGHYVALASNRERYWDRSEYRDMNFPPPDPNFITHACLMGHHYGNDACVEDDGSRYQVDFYVTENSVSDLIYSTTVNCSQKVVELTENYLMGNMGKTVI